MVENWFANFSKLKAILLIIILLLLPFVLRRITLKNLEKAPTVCIYKNMTGRDCWGCGTSRAIISILNLDFRQAYDFNKRIIIVFPILLYLWLKSIYINLKIIFKRKLPTTNLSYS